MKFELTTSGFFYKREEALKLETLGFKFENTDFHNYDCHMNCDVKPKVEFNTLEELIEFTKEWGCIIISPGRIEIYDDYRE